MTVSDEQFAQLAASVQALVKSQQDQALRAVPQNERGLLQREQQLKDYEDQIKLAENRAAEKIKAISAREMSMSTGMPVEELLKAETPEQMKDMALAHYSQTFSDPSRLRGMADTVEKIMAGQGLPAEVVAQVQSQTAPAAWAGQTAQTAAGAVAEPPAGQAPGAGTATQTTDRRAEVNNRFKGTSDMTAWLAEYRQAAPTESVSYSGDIQREQQSAQPARV